MNNKLIKTLKPIDEKIKRDILTYNSDGHSNRQISKMLGISKDRIAYFLRKSGLTSSRRVPIDMISTSQAKCKICKEVKDISQFQYGRRGMVDEYRFAYCNDCRKKQMVDNLNSDFEKYFKQKYNRWRAFNKRNNNVFDIGYDYIRNVYEKQNGLCFYSGVAMVSGVYKTQYSNSISLDKVVPELGYIEGNVVLCTTRMNTIKNDLTLDEMSVYTPMWYNKLLNCEYVNISCSKTGFQVEQNDY